MEYFIGKPTEFDVPLPPGVGTDAQRKIWSSLKSIPHGQFETYGQIAVRLGLLEGQARIIGNAVSQNPLPIIYPCHRAVAATGGLIGYSAGPHWKKALLEFEGVQIDYDKVRVPREQ
jgi:methylated-DNA-[protein]-cysteine S-methyltransferase